MPIEAEQSLIKDKNSKPKVQSWGTPEKGEKEQDRKKCYGIIKRGQFEQKYVLINSIERFRKTNAAG